MTTLPSSTIERVSRPALFDLAKARRIAAEAESRAAAAKGWSVIAQQRLYSHKPIDTAARDVLLRVASALHQEAADLELAASRLTLIVEG